VRRFDTGATRDQDADKLDLDGFISPLVELAYGRYMHKHRKQPDGNLRAADNWTKGMPREAYVKSLVRHVHDVRLHAHGYPQEAREPLEEALAAIIFNASGLLHEVLLGRDVGVPADNTAPPSSMILYRDEDAA
jgi:hypothetical protein